MNIGKMMKQVQDMQTKMADMQNRLGDVENQWPGGRRHGFCSDERQGRIAQSHH